MKISNFEIISNEIVKGVILHTLQETKSLLLMDPY